MILTQGEGRRPLVPSPQSTSLWMKAFGVGAWPWGHGSLCRGQFFEKDFAEACGLLLLPVSGEMRELREQCSAQKGTAPPPLVS